MMTAKEFTTVHTQTAVRANEMHAARRWADDDNKYTDRKTCVKYAREALKRARKANAKIVAAKRAGTARPVSLVLAAVLPLMETMATNAAERTVEHIAKVRADVARLGLDVAFPEPVRLTTNERWDRQKVARYDAAVYARSFAARVCGLVESVNAEEFATSEIEEAVYCARAQFLAFAGKLDAKVGAVTEAKLQVLRGVWGESYLYVTTAEGVAQCWKTQTIVNRSVLGKLFFQWPTRIVKN